MPRCASATAQSAAASALRCSPLLFSFSFLHLLASSSYPSSSFVLPFLLLKKEAKTQHRRLLPVRRGRRGRTGGPRWATLGPEPERKVECWRIRICKHRARKGQLTGDGRTQHATAQIVCNSFCNLATAFATAFATALATAFATAFANSDYKQRLQTARFCRGQQFGKSGYSYPSVKLSMNLTVFSQATSPERLQLSATLLRHLASSPPKLMLWD